MSLKIPEYSAEEILLAFKRAKRGEELTDREIAAIHWEVFE